MHKQVLRNTRIKFSMIWYDGEAIYTENSFHHCVQCTLLGWGKRECELVAYPLAI